MTIFEALHQAGGVLVYGIPEFRLPKENVVKTEIENVTVPRRQDRVQTSSSAKSVTIDELLNEEGFDAVFIGSGAGLPKFMGIPGENANGVFSANEYLTRSNLMKAFQRRVCYSDHGAAKRWQLSAAATWRWMLREPRCVSARRAHIVYRRSEEELPARVEEVHHAKQEGIIFDLLTNSGRNSGR